MTRIPHVAFAALLLAAAPPSPALAETKTTGGQEAPAVATGAASVGDIAIEGAWTRQSPPGAKVGGGYARITNRGTEADTLVGGSVPFAGRLEVHEMSVADGVMTMRQLADGLTIGPGETVVLKPGGLHLMFQALTEPPVEGEIVPVTLRFERGGEVTVEMPVAAIGATLPTAAVGAGHSGAGHSGAGHGGDVRETAR